LQQQSTTPENMASIPKGEESVPEPPVMNTDATPIAKAEKEEKPLPKLSAAEFRQYNRMAEHMDYFHNNFRQTWKVLYGACEAGKRPKNMSIRQFISTGEQFCHQYVAHTQNQNPFHDKQSINRRC
jgi:murein L,D-transpeptidase YafK